MLCDTYSIRKQPIHTHTWCAQTNRGITDDELAAIDVTEPAAPLPVARLPPYNGFGSLVSFTQDSSPGQRHCMQHVMQRVQLQPRAAGTCMHL